MAEKVILAIDTTGPEGIVALFIKDKEYTVRRSTLGHAEWVLPSIQKLLKRSNKSLKDISAIAVLTGPGSFTGTRVGVTIANALSWALGIPVFGISNDRAASLKEAVSRVHQGQKGRHPRFALPKYPLLR
jgi:tRNA threonylcarbamoyladenosine biosynthesis protein TsaB